MAKENKKFRTSSINIRVKDELPDQLQTIADYCNMSQNLLSNKILEAYVKRFNSASELNRKKMIMELIFND